MFEIIYIKELYKYQGLNKKYMILFKLLIIDHIFRNKSNFKKAGIEQYAIRIKRELVNIWGSVEKMLA